MVNSKKTPKSKSKVNRTSKETSKHSSAKKSSPGKIISRGSSWSFSSSNRSRNTNDSSFELSTKSNTDLSELNATNVSFVDSDGTIEKSPKLSVSVSPVINIRGNKSKSGKRKTKRLKYLAGFIHGQTSGLGGQSSANSINLNHFTIHLAKATEKEATPTSKKNSMYTPEYMEYVESDKSDEDENIIQRDIIGETSEAFQTFSRIFRDLPHWDDLSLTSSYTDLPKSSVKEIDSKKSVEEYSHSSIEFGSDELMYEAYDNNPDESQLKQPSLLTITSSEIELDDDDMSNLDSPDIEVTEKRNEVSFVSVEDQMQNAVNQSIQKPQVPDVDKIVNLKIKDFIDALIDRAVLISEEKPIYTQILDKWKLYVQLKKLVATYNEELRYNRMLDKTITDFLIRRSNYSQVKSIEDPEFRNSSQRRYISALNLVDYWLIRERESREIRNTEVVHLTEENSLKKLQADKLATQFQNILHQTILKRFDRSERLNNIVNDLKIRMDKMRDQISKIRCDLILQQNKYATILTKLDEMDIVTGGLNARQYLAAQEEVTKLIREIEARDNELRRFQLSLQSYIHAIGHMRCRGKLLRTNIQKAKKSLQIKFNMMNKLREVYFKLSRKHTRIYKEIELVKHQSGLIHYPLLLNDYDKTAAYVDMKRSQVNDLKKKYTRLFKRQSSINESARCKSDLTL